MRVTILVTRAATLIKQRRIVSRQNEDPVEPSVRASRCRPCQARSRTAPPLLTRNVRGKNRCTSAHAELTQNRLGFKSLSIVVGREGGISMISHCHRSNLDLLDSEPRPVCITKPLRE
jgi:hypothetical protein